MPTSRQRWLQRFGALSQTIFSGWIGIKLAVRHTRVSSRHSPGWRTGIRKYASTFLKLRSVEKTGRRVEHLELFVRHVDVVEKREIRVATVHRVQDEGADIHRLRKVVGAAWIPENLVGRATST